jgi:hypothetical protein
MSQKTSIGWRILKVVLIIMAVAFIILSLGWFMESSSNDAIEAEKDKDDDLNSVKPDAIEEEKKQKQTRLTQCEERIQYIEERKISITKKEKIILISSRALIGLFLVSVNAWYMAYYNWPFSLEKQLSINGAILLVYSFLAFVTYGTPTRLINALKNKIAYYLKKKHIHVIEELEPLKTERIKLKEEIIAIVVSQEQALVKLN